MDLEISPGVTTFSCAILTSKNNQSADCLTRLFLFQARNMDDLSGLDWSASIKPSSRRFPPINPSSSFSALRPTPTASGRSSPVITSNPPSKPATPANDSFSNLVSFNASSGNKNLPLLEQQKRVAQQKAEKEKAKQTQFIAGFQGADESFWENFGSGRSTPANRAAASGSNGVTSSHAAQDEDDFMAAFNEHATTKINPFGNGNSSKSSRPPPSSPEPVSKSKTGRLPQETGFADDEDDDSFGLNQLKQPRKPHDQSSMQEASLYDDDDVLGALSKPVSDVPKATRRPIKTGGDLGPETVGDPHDRAVAELVDMGFPTEKAAIALATTESGSDVSGAVSWLLQQAHADARSQMQTRRRSGNSPREDARGALRHRGTGRRSGEETDLRQETRRRREGASDGFSEKEPAKVAAEIGNNFLKTAGSLWKTGRERMQQVVQEFNSDSDSSQPRWMNEPASSSQAVSLERSRDEEVLGPRRRRESSGAIKRELVTDEALMLESDQGRPGPRKPARPKPETRVDSSADNSRDHSPAMSSRLRESVLTQPAFLKQQRQSPALSNQRAALSRQAIEEEASHAYVSSARRRKPANPAPSSASTSDLLETTTKQSLPSRPSTTVPSRPQKPATPIAVQPKAPPRIIPPMSNIAAKAVSGHRETADSHVARGDYAAAHQSYTTAISSVPDKHPVLIVLLTSHAGTAAKIGEPRTTIADSDRAMAIIGPSKGQSEMIQLGPGTPPASMREQYGKALMHKAEALEQLEKWNEAAAVWREAIEGGHGGATSIQGRGRAEKAANPETSRPKPPIAKKPALLRPPANAGAVQATSAAAVNRLRAANAAADKADDEKFALADAVAARITAWKGGKADNLRALLSSLDTVLWPDAGWKKIGMAELVLPAKVKVLYMKGIAKVHPDKVCENDLFVRVRGGEGGIIVLMCCVALQIPTTATTEQRMIAGAVFSSLNEAWDRFKTENAL